MATEPAPPPAPPAKAAKMTVTFEGTPQEVFARFGLRPHNQLLQKTRRKPRFGGKETRSRNRGGLRLLNHTFKRHGRDKHVREAQLLRHFELCPHVVTG